MTTSTENEKKPLKSTNFLIRGSDYLQSKPGFKLVGRETERAEASAVLMRRENNNLVIFGQNGVGVSSVILGLQASKDDPNTSFDVVGKRFFYLDVDALFSSGNSGTINEGFSKAMADLTRLPDTTLIIEDTKDFLDGIKNSGTNNIINILMREARNNHRFQVVFEARDENIGELLKTHSDLAEIFTFKEVREPTKDALKQIVQATVPELEEHHGVTIDPAAVDSVIDLTTKFPGLKLPVVQPKRSVVILEGALTALRQKAHACPPVLEKAKQDLQDIASVLETKGAKIPPHLQGKTTDELEAMKIEAEDAVKNISESWAKDQAKIRTLYRDIRTNEEEMMSLDNQIENKKQQENDIKNAHKALKLEGADVGKIKKDYFDKYGEDLPADSASSVSETFLSRARTSFGSSAVQELTQKRTEHEKLLQENRAEYAAITARMNEGVVLREEDILAEFSRLSGVPMNKLKQDERDKVLGLDKTLKERVFGQDEAVDAVTKAVKRGRKSLKKPNKPIGSFIFIGPSGVGKTELGKALSAALFGDESSLMVYDMSEYQDKSSSARLTGPAPGLVGYEEGGQLTNAMRRRPYCVNVFDEIEKADKSVFDMFLQIVDEGRLTDNHGIPAYFNNSINILTSNIGSKYFLDESLTFEEAKKAALADLWNPEVGGYRPEFLNRFTGVICFNRLGQIEIQKVAKKALKDLNSWVAGENIQIEMADTDVANMCKDQYVPKNGARGILNYIEQTVTTDVADGLLNSPDQPGRVIATYNTETKRVETTFIPAVVEAAVKTAQPVSAPNNTPSH